MLLLWIINFFLLWPSQNLIVLYQHLLTCDLLTWELINRQIWDSSEKSFTHKVARGLYSPWNSPGQNTRVRSLSLLQGIFPTQGLNPGLPHGRQILYQLSHKGSPCIDEDHSFLFLKTHLYVKNNLGFKFQICYLY